MFQVPIIFQKDFDFTLFVLIQSWMHLLKIIYLFWIKYFSSLVHLSLMSLSLVMLKFPLLYQILFLSNKKSSVSILQSYKYICWSESDSSSLENKANWIRGTITILNQNTRYQEKCSDWSTAPNDLINPPSEIITVVQPIKHATWWDSLLLFQLSAVLQTNISLSKLNICRWWV